MKLGVIGGSGLYELDGIRELREERCNTPFGPPSDALMTGNLDGVDLAFLPRHGRGHRLMPGEINHRANIYALKQVGVDAIISVSAVGSFREDLAPGHVVLVDQFVDRTKRAADHTFFGDGVAAHIAFSQPICPVLRRIVHEAAHAAIRDSDAAAQVHNGGVYLNMEGPAFSTLAESRLYKSWGLDVIGMTNLAEAKLAREAEMCYCTMAMVTDYDCWHEAHEAVSVEMVIATLMRNVQLAKAIIAQALPRLARGPAPTCACRSALKNAIITQPDAISDAAKSRLAPIIGAYLGC